MSDDPNVIVGGNFKEFLSLGCRFGYFALEQLVHAPAETFEELEFADFNPEASGEELSLLRRLSREFGLAPWPRPRERLEELRVQHWHQLEVPPPPSYDAS